MFWSMTVTNLFGMRTSGLIATICTLFGRVMPILFIFGLAMWFLARGNASNIGFGWSEFVPDLGDTSKLSFIVGAFLTFAGIEASASNAASARNPRKNYPIAILTSAGIALFLVTLIALAIAIVIPREQIDLDAGIMQAISVLLDSFGAGWLIGVVGLVIALGMLGEVNNWIPAPTRGLLIAGRDGALSPFWQRENRHCAHQRILLFQAAIVSAMSTMYLFFDVQVAFWLMNVVPTMLYIVMYMLMFAAAVRLRYSHPEVPRRYRVPFGSAGIWALAGLGSLAGLVALGFGFLPTVQVPEDQRTAYVAIIIAGFVTCSILPFLLYAIRRPGWRTCGEETTTRP